MLIKEFITEDNIQESPELELARRLPSLTKHDYDTIDALMRQISKKHKITGQALHNLFVNKFKKTPDDWIKNKLDEDTVDSFIKDEVKKFAHWAAEKLRINTMPKIILSMDNVEAKTNHHTGSHIVGDHRIWVYVKNRNLIDILRTVFHELVHTRQSELNMIQPGDSYPGSPIEAMADMLAGKYIKIYGKQNRNIFQ